MQTLLTVFSNSLPGREDDYNDWYTNVHIRDVMRLPGSVAVQRLVRSAHQPGAVPAHQYLAFYEIGDRAACTEGHMQNVFTPRMLISDSFDFGTLQEAYFDPAGASRRSPFGDRAAGGFITARINPKRGDHAALEAWFSPERLNAIAGLPGCIAAQLFRYGTEQMLEASHPHEYLMVCRIADPRVAANAWTTYWSDEMRAQSPIDWTDAVLAAYEPLFPRLRAGEVVSPSAQGAAGEQRARAALGTHVYHGFPSA